MKKLFLTSVGLAALPKFLGKSIKGLKVVFITTAANTYPADHRTWLDYDRKYYKEAGANLVELDINGKSREELGKICKNADIIHIAGGNTFYLLEKINESGFDEIIKRRVEEGVMYVGSSAGACLAGPDIEPIRLADDPKEAPNLKSTKGLGLVGFVVVPHFDVEKYQKEIGEIMELYDDKFKLIPLNNNQAILVEGNEYKIVKSE